MTVYVWTANLRGGKTLGTVGEILRALNEGRRVATNLDIWQEELINPWARETEIYRLPDKPEAEHLHQLPPGYDGDIIEEERNGELVLDECGTWLNAHGWKDKARAALKGWMVEAGKRRWNVHFIIQDLDSLDSQFRRMFAEFEVKVIRTDRFTIPIIGRLLKPIFGKKMPVPKVHVATFLYRGSYSERRYYRGKDLYNGYDTEQKFSEENQYKGVSRYLPPYYVYGRYNTKWDKFKDEIRKYKVSQLQFFFAGLCLAYVATNSAVTMTAEAPRKGWFGCNEPYKQLFGDCNSVVVLPQYAKQYGYLGNNKKDKIGQIGASQSGHKTEAEDPIYITGSVRSSAGFDYLFEQGGEPFYPDFAGYHVRWIAPCKAQLVSGELKTIVNCKA
jgi:hypothetical protein